MRLQSFHPAKITTVASALSTVAILLLSVAVASPTTSKEVIEYLPTVNNAYAATDTVEPYVAIFKPTGTVPTNTIIVGGTAWDNIGGSKVNRVEVKIDGKSSTYKKATPEATGDWSKWSVSISIPSTGSHTLTARATDNAGNQYWDTSSITVSKVVPSAGTDKFGIKKIFPTKSAGREWFINMANPASDGVFSTGQTYTTLADITKNADGSWRVSGKEYDSGYRYQIRMIVDTPSGQSQWRNIEWTAYVRPIQTFAKDSWMESDLYNAFILYARGGLHSNETPCTGSALKGGLELRGVTWFKKEIWHGGGGDATSASVETAISPLLSNKDSNGHYYGGNKWIGLKVIMYNINYNEDVRMEIWLDKNANNVWEKVNEYTDDGSWYANKPNFWDAGCEDPYGDPKPRNYVIRYEGPFATLRTDNMEFDFKNLSVREIQAP